MRCRHAQQQHSTHISCSRDKHERKVESRNVWISTRYKFNLTDSSNMRRWERTDTLITATTKFGETKENDKTFYMKKLYFLGLVTMKRKHLIEKCGLIRYRSV